MALALDPSAMLVLAGLARHGGVRAAAAAMGVPRSTLSRRLADLEAQAGGPLVVRTARRFVLTDLGAALLERCNELDDLVRRSEELVRSASSEASGTLKVAAAPVIGEEILPDLVAELLRQHPRLSIELRLSVDYVDLRRGDVDVALRAWPLDDASDLFAVRVGVSTTGCWVSPGYAKSRGTPKVPADLAAHDCILVGSSTPAAWTFRAGSREQRVDVSGRVRVDSFRVARELATKGVGVVRTARMSADPLVASGQLVPVLERYWPRTVLHAVHAGANPPSPKVRAFIELLRKAVPKVLPPATGLSAGPSPRRG
jgi:DNA-binding transcriptional LysR family regulator